MQLASYIIALIGTLVLFVSGVAWWSMLRQPQPQVSAGRFDREGRANLAAIAIVASFGLSVVAAILAIFSWIF